MAAETRKAPAGGIGRAAVGGVAWNLGSHVLDKLIGFAAFAFVVRLLTVELAGVVMLAVAAIDIVAVLAFSGIGSRIIQHHAPDQRLTSTAFWVQVSAMLLLMAGIQLGAGTAGRLLDEPRIVPLLHALSFVLLPQGVAIIPSSLLSRALRYRELSLCALASSSLGALGGVIVALAGHPFWALVTQRFVASIAFAVLSFVVSGWRPALVFDGPLAGETIRFAAPLMGSALTVSMHAQATTLIVGAFLPVEVVAFYRVATRLSEVLFQFSLGPVTRVFLSVFSLLRADRDRARRAFLNVLAVVAFVTFGAYGLVSGTASSVMVMLFGPAWAPAGPVFVLIALASVTLPLTAFISPALTAAGRTNLVFLFHLTNLLALLATVFAAVPFGLDAVLYTAIGRSLALAPLPFLALRAAFGLGPLQLLPVLLPPLSAALVAGVAGHGVLPMLLTLPLPLAIGLAWMAAGVVLIAVQVALAWRRSREIVRMLSGMLRQGGLGVSGTG
jgi:PST family polysaccharide transporter